VREYWIVDPDAKSVDVLTRQEGDLKTVQVFLLDDKLSSPLLQEFQLSLSSIFKP
jgi:Uma2 family endonuclease